MVVVSALTSETHDDRDHDEAQRGNPENARQKRELIAGDFLVGVGGGTGRYRVVRGGDGVDKRPIVWRREHKRRPREHAALRVVTVQTRRAAPAHTRPRACTDNPP